MEKKARGVFRIVISTFIWAAVFLLGGYYVFLKLTKSGREVKDRLKNGKTGRDSNDGGRKKDRRVNLKTLSVEESSPVSGTSDLTARQKEIISMLGKDSPTSISDLLKTISGVSTRTLRRDMVKLEKKGLIRRKGSTRATEYFRI
ncbi:DeoR family transcriptional regulator [Candidatus Dojkabacteria bacterium]|nr:DeoR family transcriptional regulator [Candidatus Dojkabacteria bacterium]